MSEEGHEHAETLLAEAGLLPEGSSLYEASNITLVHHLYASLRARNLYRKETNTTLCVMVKLPLWMKLMVV